jgi:site-specific DNA-methyltransferase (adenine-specific)
MDQRNIERFYDYFDGVADLLYRSYQRPYLEGMNEAFSLLLDQRLQGSYGDEDLATIQALRDDIVDVSFEREEVRKSVQLGMLKAYKHLREPNARITPDTIGIFLAYLIRRFRFDEEVETLFDPLVGSGNLLYTVANQLDTSPVLYGVDQDRLHCDIARNVGDLLEYEANIYCQDTLTFYHTGFDVAVMDMPITSDEPYPPYLILNHHIDSVAPGGYVFAVIENDFFTQEGGDTFRQEILSKGVIVGLLQLPMELFQSNPKSILILRRHTDKKTTLDGFLLAEVPSFYDEDGMTRVLRQIDQWITTRKDDLS